MIGGEHNCAAIIVLQIVGAQLSDELIVNDQEILFNDFK